MKRYLKFIKDFFKRVKLNMEWDKTESIIRIGHYEEIQKTRNEYNKKLRETKTIKEVDEVSNKLNQRLEQLNNWTEEYIKQEKEKFFKNNLIY